MSRLLNYSFVYIVFVFTCFLGFSFASFNKSKQYSASYLPLDTLQFHSQLALDTLFSMSYFYPFDLQVRNDSFCLGLMGADNVFYYYEYDSLAKQFKIENKYFIETIELSSDYLLFGIGAESQNEYLFVYNNEFEYLYNRTTLQVNELNANGIALCWADYSKNESLFPIEQMVSYHYLFDVKSGLHSHKFKDNYLVVHGYDGFYECDINSYCRQGGQMEMVKYDELGNQKDIFSIYLPKQVIPTYFLSNKYIVEKSGKIIVYDFQGDILVSFEIAPRYYYKFVIKDDELSVFGWLDTDKDQSAYSFVKQVFFLSK